MTGPLRKRTVLAGGLACLLTAACGGGGPSSPAAPSRPSAALSSGASEMGIGQPAMWPIVGGRSANLASCLRGAADPACFMGAGVAARAVGAAVAAPGAPRDLSATASGDTVTLTWRADGFSSPVVTYVIEAGSSSGASDLADFPTNSTDTTFSASGIGRGKYYVRVRARNEGGVSDPSNEAILLVGASGCTSEPNAPQELRTTATGSIVSLWWLAPFGGCAVSSYVIEAGSRSGASDLANFATNSTGLTFTASGVAAGTYYVRVRAQNSSGVSAPSNESTLIVGATVINVTGRWVGVAPDGFRSSNAAACDLEQDLQLDLVQDEYGKVTGTHTTTTRKIGNCGQLGRVTTMSLDGNLAGDRVLYTAFSSRALIGVNGTVNGNTMSGIFAGSDGTAGTFVVTRQ